MASNVFCRLTPVRAQEEQPLHHPSAGKLKTPSTIPAGGESTEYLQSQLGLPALTSCPVAISIAV